MWPTDSRWMRRGRVAMTMTVAHLHDMRPCSCSESFTSSILFNFHNHLVSILRGFFWSSHSSLHFTDEESESQRPTSPVTFGKG